MLSDSEWKKHNNWEVNWWGDCSNTSDEEAKQDEYAKYLGLDSYRLPGILGLNLDMQGKSVLDVGGGPISMTLKMRNRGRTVVVDPGTFPQWVLERYKSSGIEFVNEKFEYYQADEKFDELLIYNVLQHTQDPEMVLKNAKKLGKTIRIFEWIDTVSNEGHPHVQTKEWLDRQLGVYGQTVQLTWAGRITPLAYHAVVQAEEPDVKLRLHLLGLAHLPTRKEISACFSDDTEILTEDGWRTLKELCECDAHIRVATLNPDRDVVEYHYPDEWITLNYKGKMFHEVGQSVDFMVTPDHNLWASTRTCISENGKKKVGRKQFRFIQAEKANKQMKYRKHFPWGSGKEGKYFSLPEYKNRNTKTRFQKQFPMDDWLRFFGIWLAEGSIDGTPYVKKYGTVIKNTHVVNIAQENETNISIIDTWVKKLGFDCEHDGRAWRICDVQLATYLAQFGKSKEKYIPKEFKSLNKRQLTILLDALLLGDGWNQGGLKRYVSYSRKLADDVNEIATKLGYGVTQYDDPDPECPRHIVTMSKNNLFPEVGTHKNEYLKREWVDYSGKVYCLSVPNHIVYVRRNGKSVFIGQCAYTQKVYKLAQMMRSLGHYVIFYGVEDSEVDCDEYHIVLTDAERRACYGDYDWNKEFFKHDGKDAAYTMFANRASEIINQTKQARDFLLVPMGNYQQQISEKTGVVTIESGIGYSGVFAKYRVFESYAWMHYIYGLLRQGDGSWYDAVIPNYFDPADFPFCQEKEDYFLYIGRVIKRKGVEVASQVAKHLGKKLVIAGQGGLVNAAEGIDLTNEKHIEYIGTVGPEERKKVMGKAILTFMPTYYIEPFGGVAVESMMCGTPVLTTDWGVFSETIQHGITGYRCRTFDDFVWGAKNIDKIIPIHCHNWAVKNYSMDRIKWMYDEYFHKIYDLYDRGWYRIHSSRDNLDWLKRWPTGVT